MQIESQYFADLPQVTGKLDSQELHRLALETDLPGMIIFEHRSRAGAKGAVVEDDDAGIEEE